MLTTLLILTGIAHIGMAIGSMTVPTLLDWKKPLNTVPPLLRQVFYAYAAFTKGVIIFFGIISILGAHELVGTSFLAKSLNSFIVAYWLARLCVGFFYYDRSELKGIARFSDRTLIVLFVIFIAVHGAAFAMNMMWL